jgi:hypothetical protein
MSARSGKPSRSCPRACATELRLADILDGFVSRPGSGQRTRVQLRVRELPGERHVQPIDIEESVRREESLTRTRPAQRHHHSLIIDLLVGSKTERRQHPGTRRYLQVTPSRYRDPPAGAKDPVYLGDRFGCGGGTVHESAEEMFAHLDVLGAADA